MVVFKCLDGATADPQHLLPFLIAEVAAAGHATAQIRQFFMHPLLHGGFRSGDLFKRQRIELSGVDRLECNHLFAGAQRPVLGLFQNFAHAPPMFDRGARFRVEAGGEAGEGFQLLELRIGQTQIAGDLSKGRILGFAADP